MSDAALSSSLGPDTVLPAAPCHTLDQVVTWLERQMSIFRQFPVRSTYCHVQSAHNGGSVQDPHKVLGRVSIANAACDRAERWLRDHGYSIEMIPPAGSLDMRAAERRLWHCLAYSRQLLADSLAPDARANIIPDQVPAPVRRVADQLQTHAWILSDAQQVTEFNSLDVCERIMEFNYPPYENLLADFLVWVAKRLSDSPTTEVVDLSKRLSAALQFGTNINDWIRRRAFDLDAREAADNVFQEALEELNRTRKIFEDMLVRCGISPALLEIRELWVPELPQEHPVGPPLGSTPTAVPVPWPEVMSAKEIANLLRTPEEATRKKLERLDEKYFCRFEDEDLGVLYRTKPIRADMEAWAVGRKRP
jgi:hypothetical protein